MQLTSFPIITPCNNSRLIIILRHRLTNVSLIHITTQSSLIYIFYFNEPHQTYKQTITIKHLYLISKVIQIKSLPLHPYHSSYLLKRNQAKQLNTPIRISHIHINQTHDQLTKNMNT